MSKFIVNISGEAVQIEVTVNTDGNLVLGGVGSVLYEMFNDELILSKVPENY